MNQKQKTLDMLKELGFSDKDIDSAISVIQKSCNCDEIEYEVEAIMDVITQLNECQDTMPKAKRQRIGNFDSQIEYENDKKENNRDNIVDIDPFPKHLTMEECSKLEIGDSIDHRDYMGRWEMATITEKHDSNLRIAYQGWGKKWDCFSNYKLECFRFAKYKTISRRPAHRLLTLKTNDLIDINPSIESVGWKTGKITMFDDYSGQIRVSYFDHNNENKLCWEHLDNIDAIQKFDTKNDSKTINEKFGECSICFEHSNTVCIPCGHICLCKDCGIDYSKTNENNLTCPICSQKVDKIYDIFF